MLPPCVGGQPKKLLEQLTCKLEHEETCTAATVTNIYVRRHSRAGEGMRHHLSRLRGPWRRRVTEKPCREAFEKVG
tara:strand:+ start:744 stop:971 length:228 start_codon:yes stop_codon:yes gene_type:complete